MCRHKRRGSHFLPWAREWSWANCSLIPGPEALGQPGARIFFSFSPALLFREGLLAFLLLLHITNHWAVSFRQNKADEEPEQEQGSPAGAHIFTRILTRAEKGKEIIFSMFKVRTLPVRFAAKKRSEDRSSVRERRRRAVVKTTRTPHRLLHPEYTLLIEYICICIYIKTTQFGAGYCTKIRAFSVRHCRRSSVCCTTVCWRVRLDEKIYIYISVWRDLIRKLPGRILFWTHYDVWNGRVFNYCCCCYYCRFKQTEK